MLCALTKIVAKEESSFTQSLLASSSIIAASSDIQKTGFSYCFSCEKSGKSPALPRITSYQGIAAGDFFLHHQGKNEGSCLPSGSCGTSFCRSR